jgi:hypothetical protein
MSCSQHDVPVTSFLDEESNTGSHQALAQSSQNFTTQVWPQFGSTSAQVWPDFGFTLTQVWLRFELSRACYRVKKRKRDTIASPATSAVFESNSVNASLFFQSLNCLANRAACGLGCIRDTLDAQSRSTLVSTVACGDVQMLDDFTLQAD